MEAWRRPELGWASWKHHSCQAPHASQQEKTTGRDLTLTWTLGRTAMTDTTMQKIRLRLMKTLCSVQSSGWV